MGGRQGVGTLEMAREAYIARYHGSDQIAYLASGEDRTVYRDGDVVYKVGSRPTANPYDHDVQTEARARGYRWAPPASTLWTFTNEYGEEETVLAMPYLEDDGSAADPRALTEMHQQTGGGVDRGNYVVIGGQPIVMDCCTVRLN